MDSQAIVNTMEVLESKPLNELCQEVTIKVCYVSDEANPNDTVITREVGKQIAASLPGAPVAGFFNKETGDFEQHSRKLVVNKGHFEVEDVTKAYGFVSPVDNPWYQDFLEDGVTRTYLMCKAYLWTRQYEEAKKAVDKGQSMELDESTMSGYQRGDVFVFTDVTLEKLCILGDAYPPCFEGAKIMSTYTKEYENLAEQLEKIIGRRYYVMNDHLAEKPTRVALDYAVGLGWSLEEAVYQQLVARGMENYSIQGIYSDSEEIFVIVQNRENLEYERIVVYINSDQTVELDSTVTAVKMEWVIKPQPTAEAVEALEGNPGSVNPEQDIPMNVAASYTDQNATPPAEQPAEQPQAEAPATTFAEGETSAEATADGAPVAENPEPVAEEPEKPAEPETEFSEATTESAPAVEATVEPAPAEPAAPAEPEVDYAAKITEFEAQIADYQKQIETLTNELNTYKAKELDALEAQKDATIQSYAAMLTEEEMAPVVEKKAEYSLDEIDAKLALTFAKKAKANPSVNFQVNIDTVAPTEPELPDFIKKAREYDKSREFTLIS